MACFLCSGTSPICSGLPRYGTFSDFAEGTFPELHTVVGPENDGSPFETRIS